MLQEKKHLSFNVDVNRLGNHSACTGGVNLYASRCTVEPSINYICLYSGWSMGDVKVVICVMRW